MRFGYRRLRVLLPREGWEVGKERFYRLYTEEGLALRRNRGDTRRPSIASKPTDNAAIESFNGRFRDECLNVHWFEGLEDASTKIEAWRQDYNANHPHRALKGLSPNEYARLTMESAAESL